MKSEILRKLWKENRKTILGLLVVGIVIEVIYLAVPDSHPIIEGTVAILAFLAIMFAAKQYLDSREHTDTLKSHTDLLKSHTDLLGKHANDLGIISKSMSTKSLGELPGFLVDHPEKSIVKLVNEADDKLTILCDLPAYAGFSAENHFVKYKQAIESKLYDNRNYTITETEISEYNLFI